jgi:hypothetical protein
MFGTMNAVNKTSKKSVVNGTRYCCRLLVVHEILANAAMYRRGGTVDVNRNAFRIVRSLTEGKKEDPRTAAARRGGKAGGPARAQRLTPEERRAISVKANRARWHKSA